MEIEEILALVVLGIVALALIFIWIPIWIKPNWEEYKNNKMPVVEVKATCMKQKSWQEEW